MKHTFSIVLFFILSIGLNAQTVEGTVGSDGSLIPYNVSASADVQDGTITEAKLDASLASKVNSSGGLLGTTTIEEHGGDGTDLIDDSDAFESALNTGKKVIGSPTATYIINTSKSFSTGKTYKFDGQGCKIISTSSNNSFLLTFVNARIEFENFEFDGQSYSSKFMYMNGSDANLKNIDVRNLYSSINQSFAFQIDIKTTDGSFKDFVSDNVNGYNLESLKNSVIGDGQGVTRLFYIRYVQTDEPANLVFKNGYAEDLFGDDGDAFDFDSTNDEYDHEVKATIDNYTIKNCTRRAIKGFASNVTVKNCTLYMIAGDNTEITTPTALVSFGREDISVDYNVNSGAYNNRFIDENTTPVNVDLLAFGTVKNFTVFGNVFKRNVLTSGGLGLGFFNALNGVEISNNTFYNANITGFGATNNGNIKVSNNEFTVDLRTNASYVGGFFRYGSTGGISDVDILNNTFTSFDNTDNLNNYGVFYAGGGTTNNINILDNTYLTKGTNGSRYFLRTKGSMTSNSRIMGNKFIGKTGVSAFRFDSSATSTFSNYSNVDGTNTALTIVSF
ncbi:tail protein [Cellulophaga phage phi18:3]|uniref:Structural protein n=1 Tax=Cellulophaga phage phi18:3 TaxID=1327983 RepID=R9ZZ34_9CAUD|nr:tail protein [Cellulophaga phage phi18:3]AGO48599.1 structural protein [Cellulophaga phage phi18:3]